MAFDPRCTRCGAPCFSEVEVDMLFCNRCADKEIARHNEQREWEYFHDPASPGGDRAVLTEARRKPDGTIEIVSIGEVIEGEVNRPPLSTTGRGSDE